MSMARGNSGRIVLEIDPRTKDALYGAVTAEGLTLKSWFLRHVDSYLADGEASGELQVAESRPRYGDKEAHSSRTSPARKKKRPS